MAADEDSDVFEITDFTTASEWERYLREIMGVLTVVLATIALIQAHSNMANAFTKNPDCGSRLGCYSDCSGNECGFEMTYVKNGDKIDIVLKKSLTSTTAQWIAVGFSNDQKMGGDSVVECVDEGSQGVAVYNSYNDGRSNRRLGTNAQDGLVDEGLSNTAGSISNNIMMCSFSKNILLNKPKIFSLNKPYYVLLGNGIFNSANGFKSKHQVTPKISPSMIDLQIAGDLSGEADIPLIKAHGSLMIVAWILAASIGIVFARYYKPVWPDQQLIGEKVWFQFHRGLMVIAVLAEIAGFVLIFVHAQAWLTFEGQTDFKKSHPFLGVIVTALCLINPIMALFRPHPGDKYRIVFNWAHWGVGTVAHILGVLTIIIGVTLEKSKAHDYTIYVIVAYAIYQFIIEIILEIHSCCADRNKAKGEAYEMKDRGQYGQQQERKNNHTFKKIILGLHVIIILGFSAAIIVMVNIGNKSL